MYPLRNIGILTFLFVLINFTLSKSWESEDLATLDSSKILVDTNYYIDKSGQDFNNILDYAYEIQSLRKFKVFIYFIESISDKYKESIWYLGRKNIEFFVNDLAFIHLKGNLEDDKNSLFILFSIEDKQNTIRTGENVKKFLGDSYSTQYLKDLKYSLRSAKYTQALKDLLYNVNWRITKDTSLSDFFSNFVSVLILGGFCFFLVASLISRNSSSSATLDKGAEDKLKKIKEICEKNVNNVKFLEDNCIICLEEYSQEEKDKVLNKNQKKLVNEEKNFMINTINKENNTNRNLFEIENNEKNIGLLNNDKNNLQEMNIISKKLI